MKRLRAVGIVALGIAFLLEGTAPAFAASANAASSSTISTIAGSKPNVPTTVIFTKPTPTSPNPQTPTPPQGPQGPIQNYVSSSSAAVPSNASSASSAAMPPGPDSCFAYYKFGSVKLNVDSNVNSTTNGTPLPLQITITNTNDYPIVDGAVYLKIFKKRPDGEPVNGPDVVDEYFATDTVDLDAGASTTIAGAYLVPNYATTGDYQIGAYFTTEKQFNLSGLTFTDDVVNSTFDFSVTSNQSGGVSFDKDAVTVAGTSYKFASYPPTVPKNQPIIIQARVDNTSNVDRVVEVNWNVYEWDAQLASNIVSTSTKQIFLPANTSTTTSEVVTNNTYPVYLAVGTVSYEDSNSIINVRFVRQGVDRARLNFPSITSFPLKAGVPETFFSCLYNSGLSPIIAPHTLDLTLMTPAGGVIKDYSLTLPITSAMMLAKDVFTPNENYSDFILKATLKDQSGKIVDQASVTYDCKDINPALCIGNGFGGANKGLIAVFAILALVILAYFAFRLHNPERKNKK